MFARTHLTALALLLIGAPATAYTGKTHRLGSIGAAIVPGAFGETLDLGPGGGHSTSSGDNEDDEDDVDGLDCFLECDEGYLECNQRAESSGDLCANSATYAYFNGLIDYKTYVTLVQGCNFGANVGGTICDGLFVQCFAGCVH